VTEAISELGEALPRELSRLIDAGWVVAAYLVLQRGDVDEELRSAAEQVLLLSGLPTSSKRHDHFVAAVASQLKQIAGFGAGTARRWADLDDDVLVTQGRASRLVADWIADEVCPAIGLSARMGRPGAAFLDVGTGTGQLAAQIARRFPGVRVVGLDVAERPLRLARGLLADNPQRDHIELRLADVAELEEEAAFDVAWLPVNVIAPPVLGAALASVRRSLRPGGWVIASSVVAQADLPITQAIMRLVTIFYGGSPLNREELMPLLAQAGFGEIRVLPDDAVSGALIGGRRAGGEDD
jgi:SAM-dependent methyltransferase